MQGIPILHPALALHNVGKGCMALPDQPIARLAESRPTHWDMWLPRQVARGSYGFHAMPPCPSAPCASQAAVQVH